MPVTSLEEPKKHFQPKWDWALAFALFIGGMSTDEILSLEQFQGMNKKMLQNRAAKDGWIAKRRETQQELGTSMARSLSERLLEAGEVHQEFMRHRLERERSALDSKLITNDMNDQNLRLKNLGMIDDMARKLTGLDDRKPVDPQRLNLSITVALASGHQPTKKQGTAGISGSRNAILVSVETAPKHAKTVPEHTLNEAVSILRAKEAGELKVFAKSEPTIDIEVDDIDRENLPKLPTLKVIEDEETLVNEIQDEGTKNLCEFETKKPR